MLTGCWGGGGGGQDVPSGTLTGIGQGFPPAGHREVANQRSATPWDPPGFVYVPAGSLEALQHREEELAAALLAQQRQAALAEDQARAAQESARLAEQLQGQLGDAQRRLVAAEADARQVAHARGALPCTVKQRRCLVSKERSPNLETAQ